MSQDNISIELLEKRLKKSEHWRDDFKVKEVKNEGGIITYGVTASDSDSKTILAIAKLNEILQQS